MPGAPWKATWQKSAEAFDPLGWVKWSKPFFLLMNMLMNNSKLMTLT